MRTSQRQFIQLFNNALKNTKTNQKSAFDWEKIYEDAKAHKVQGLIYTAISEEMLETMDKDLLKRWKVDTFNTGISQIIHIKQIERILALINKAQIPVVVLKGLVVREYYHRPELRTMCDADILVKESDLDKVRELLLNEGYEEGESTEAHLVFYHSSHMPVEVHWTLADGRFFRGNTSFEKNLWENTQTVKVGEVSVLSLGDEDLSLHLCVHMATHIISSGFGIRQIADLALLVDKIGEQINWNHFINKTKECGVEKFTIVIFMLARELFDIQIPNVILQNTIKSRKNIDNFLQDILVGGAFGTRDLARMFGNQLAYDMENREVEKAGIGRLYLRLIFPSVENLPERYGYAKTNKLLLPIAYIHHIFAGLLNQQYSIKDKYKVLFSSFILSKRKNKLIQWLDL